MTLSVEEQIDAELDALSKRLAGLHQHIKDRPAMKYALESLPELIGARDYHNLCEAMGLDMNIQPPTGAEFAEIVHGRVRQNERRAWRMSASVSAMLDADHKAAAEYMDHAARQTAQVVDQSPASLEGLR